MTTPENDSGPVSERGRLRIMSDSDPYDVVEAWTTTLAENPDNIAFDIDRADVEQFIKLILDLRAEIE